MSTTKQPMPWSAPELTVTRITILGTTLVAFTYGIATCLFILIVQLRVAYSIRTLRSSWKAPGQIQNIILTMYTCGMFALVSICICSNNHLLWNFFPSAPQMPFNLSLLEDYGVGRLGAFASVINNWMADALLVGHHLGLIFVHNIDR